MLSIYYYSVLYHDIDNVMVLELDLSYRLHYDVKVIFIFIVEVWKIKKKQCLYLKFFKHFIPKELIISLNLN